MAWRRFSVAMRERTDTRRHMPCVLLLLLQCLRTVAPDDAFGRRQGVSSRLHEVPTCRPPMLPTAAGRCDFNYESGMVYLPEPGLALAEASPPWMADAAEFRRRAHDLQRPRSCAAAKWSVVRMPYKYGVAGALQHFTVIAAKHWENGRGVFVPTQDPWKWAQNDGAVPNCPYLFGCYFRAFQGCNADQVARERVVVFKQRSIRDPGEPKAVDSLCDAKRGAFSLRTGVCPHEDATREGYSIKFRRWYGDGFSAAFERRWGGLAYEAMLTGIVFDPTPSYKARLERYVASLGGLGASAGPSGRCIAIHARRGDACHTNWRKCHDFSEYMAVAQRMRKAYGISKIYLATDSTELTSAANLRKYPEFEFVFQKMDRSVYGGAKASVWVEHKVESLGNAMDTVFKDIWAASRCDVFIGTFFAHIGRIILELMIQRRGSVPPYAALDTPFCRKFAKCQVSNAQLRSRLHGDSIANGAPTAVAGAAWTVDAALALHRQQRHRESQSQTRAERIPTDLSGDAPFNSQIDARWLPLLRHASVTSVKRLPIKYTSHVLWKVTLKGAEFAGSAIFRSAAQGLQAVHEVAAFHIDRAMHMYRAPPAVGRCIATSTVRQLAPKLLAQLNIGSATSVCGSLVMFVDGLRGWPEKCENMQDALCDACPDAAGAAQRTADVQRALGDMAFFDFVVLLRDRNIFKEAWPRSTITRCTACAQRRAIYATNFFCQVGTDGKERLLLMDNGASFGREPVVRTRFLAFDGLCPSPNVQKAIREMEKDGGKAWQRRLFSGDGKLDAAAFGQPLVGKRKLLDVQDRIESVAYHVNQGGACQPRPKAWFAKVASAGGDIVLENLYSKAFVGRLDGAMKQNKS